MIAGVWIALAAVFLEACGQEPPAVDGWRAPAARVAPHVRLGLAEAGFRVHQTTHFIVSHNTSNDVLNGLVNRLDRVYAAVRRFAEDRELVDAQDPEAPLEVLFFEDFEAYAAFARSRGENASQTAGFFHWNENVAVFYNAMTRPDLVEINRQIEAARAAMLAVRREGRPDAGAELQRFQRQINVWETQRDAFVEEANGVALMHEAAHQCLFHFGVHAAAGVDPTWLVEGLACLFEKPQTISQGKAVRVNERRLADLRAACAGRAAAGGGSCVGPLPLRDFVAAPRVVADRGREDIIGLYAESWALVYYLQFRHAEAFTKYLKATRRRNPDRPLSPQEEVAAMESGFGAPIDELQALCSRYLETLRRE